MCIVSSVGDEWNRRQKGFHGWRHPPDTVPFPQLPPLPKNPDNNNPNDIIELIKVFEAARKIDVDTGNEDCVDNEKLAFIDELIENMKIKFAESILEGDDSESAKLRGIITSLQQVKTYI